jgi:MFS family permease
MPEAPPPAQTRPRKIEWLAALGITLLILALHFRFLAQRGGFWRDEVNLLNLSRQNSLADMAKDSFPVLMPLLVRAWTTLAGSGDGSLQLLGALIGLGGIAALWSAAWTARRAPPLLGLALFGGNSIVIAYSDSLRAYGLGSALLVTFAAAAWSFINKPTPKRFALLAVLAVLTAQTLFQNSILIAAVSAGALAVCVKRKMWRTAAQIILAGAVAAVSLLPYLPGIHAAQTAGAGLRSGFRWSLVGNNLATLTGFPLEQFEWVWLALTLIVAAGVIAGWSRQARFDGWLFTGGTLLAAVVGFSVFLNWAALPTRVWYFLPLLALTATCVEIFCPLLVGRSRTVFFGFAIATGLIATPFAWRNLNQRFTNIDFVAQHLKAEATPKDYILITPWLCGISFERYAVASPARWDTVPPIADHSKHRFDLVRNQMRSTNAIAPLLEKISATLRAGGRIWIVGDVDIPESATPAPADLPPPPLQWTGWQDTPYNMIWDMQIAHFIRDHTHRFESVLLNIKQPVSDIENLPLRVAEGWRDDIVSPPPVELPIK